MRRPVSYLPTPLHVKYNYRGYDSTSSLVLYLSFIVRLLYTSEVYTLFLLHSFKLLCIHNDERWNQRVQLSLPRSLSCSKRAMSQSSTFSSATFCVTSQILYSMGAYFGWYWGRAIIENRLGPARPVTV